MRNRSTDREARLIRYIRSVLRILESEAARCQDMIAPSIPPLIFWRNDGSPKLFTHNGKTKFLKSDNCGNADFEIAVLGKPRLHIEAKSLKGQQSPHQVEHQKRVELVGERYCVVRTPEEFNRVMIDYGVKHWALMEGK